jgi:hypothetical protein
MVQASEDEEDSSGSFESEEEVQPESTVNVAIGSGQYDWSHDGVLPLQRRTFSSQGRRLTSLALGYCWTVNQH